MLKLRDIFVLACVGASILLTVDQAFGQRGGGRGGGGRGGNQGGQVAPPRPNPNNNAQVIADRKEIETIQGEINGTTKQLGDLSKKISEEFEKSDEYTAALKAQEAAVAEVRTAKEAVLVKLKVRADYKAAMEKEHAAQAKMDKLRSSGAPQEERAAQSKIVLDLGGVTSKLEREALNADPAYAAAQQKLKETNVVLADLKKKLGETIKGDDNFKQLQITLTEQKTKLDEANKKLQADFAAASRN